LLAIIPISINATGPPKRRFNEKIQSWLDQINFTPFASQDKLYGRIVYFNHEKSNARDIDNILKPIFDRLKSVIYQDDHSILHCEGIRLDMVKYGSSFNLEIDWTRGSTVGIGQIYNHTCLLIEVGQLPLTERSLVHVIWLQEAGGTYEAKT
jgi:hypothetical protein